MRARIGSLTFRKHQSLLSLLKSGDVEVLECRLILKFIWPLVCTYVTAYITAIKKTSFCEVPSVKSVWVNCIWFLCLCKKVILNWKIWVCLIMKLLFICCLFDLYVNKTSQFAQRENGHRPKKMIIQKLSHRFLFNVPKVKFIFRQPQEVNPWFSRRRDAKLEKITNWISPFFTTNHLYPKKCKLSTRSFNTVTRRSRKPWSYSLQTRRQRP